MQTDLETTATLEIGDQTDERDVTVSGDSSETVESRSTPPNWSQASTTGRSPSTATRRPERSRSPTRPPAMTAVLTEVTAMRNAYVDQFPTEARVIKAAFWSSFIALAIGGSLGLVQALHRTDVFRFLESPDYYTVLTAHGVLLAISFTIFFLVGVFTWAVTTSLDRGVEDIRFTWGWYAMMVVGTVLVGVTIFAGFLEEPPVVLGSELYADVLFTFYAPLQAHPFFTSGWCCSSSAPGSPGSTGSERGGPGGARTPTNGSRSQRSWC